jgi:predicted metalloprotease with PDZ domain
MSHRRSLHVAEPVHYRIDLRNRLHHLVEVTLTIPPDLARGARLVLPVWTPGSYVVRDYARHVQTIRAEDATGNPVPVTMDTHTSWVVPADVDGHFIKLSPELAASATAELEARVA